MKFKVGDTVRIPTITWKVAIGCITKVDEFDLDGLPYYVCELDGHGDDYGWYREEYVKEFIRDLKKELKKNCLIYPQVIDKLAGEGLI